MNNSMYFVLEIELRDCGNLNVLDGGLGFSCLDDAKEFLKIYYKNKDFEYQEYFKLIIIDRVISDDCIISLKVT